jgi:hypothetical protein
MVRSRLGRAERLLASFPVRDTISQKPEIGVGLSSSGEIPVKGKNANETYNCRNPALLHADYSVLAGIGIPWE